MKARSVARELALMTLFQMDGQPEAVWEKVSLNERVLATVRTLVSMAEEQLQQVTTELGQFHDTLVEAEMTHPLNESIPVDEPTQPVPVPTTREMAQKLEQLLQAVNQLEDALALPEIQALSRREDVQNYCLMLMRNTLSHQADIDARIDAASHGWRVGRLQKMDRLLLRLASSELLYAKNVDPATIITESLELAKRFTSAESRQFLHGVLGAIADQAALGESPPAPDAETADHV